VIPNDRLLSISDRHVSVLDAFKAADQVLLSGVQGITDLITTPGLINLDFADVKSVMSGAGSALMGIGSSRGDDRAVAAAEMAISSPLLEASIDGAHGVLLSIQGGSDLGLFEINEAAQLVSNSAAVDANIIFGAVIDDALGDEVRVTVIAAGFDEQRPSRPATSAFSLLDGRPSSTGGGSSSGHAASSATGGGSTSPATGNGNGHSASNGAQPGSSSAAWGGSASTGNAAQSASGTAAGPLNPGAGPTGPAAMPSQPASWTTSPPAPAVGAATTPGATPGAGTGTAGGTGQAAEPPASPGTDGSAYVPAPVSFVSPDEDEGYGAKPGYGGYPREERDSGGDAAAGWKDSGRPAKQDKVFDVNAGRRRPVVFEEEDDLDVPDFLK